MKRVREVIVVEGRYDKIRLEGVVDAVIIPLDGFQVFHNAEQLRMLRELAASCGLLVLTDSDSAGFLLRNYLGGALPPQQVKHAYIPEIRGKEKRKAVPGKEGLLGVEGMDGQTLLKALQRAGATFEDDSPQPAAPAAWMTKQRLYADGLAGRDNSAARRQRLLQLWGFPQKISANRLVDVINAAKSPQEYEQALRQIEESQEEQIPNPREEKTDSAAGFGKNG
mgnify:CR=1 FL=1